MGNTFILVVVVITGLGFDFTNGFHDSANAVATSIATGALKPRVAVAMSGVLNLLGAFLSLSVAATIASGIVDQGSVTLEVVFAGLVGGIAWNVATWYLGMPSSSSHALIGGVIGAELVHAGGSAVIWSGVAGKVFIPAIFAPIFAMIVAGVGTVLAYRITKKSKEQVKTRSFRIGQAGTAALVSLAHGTNDAQKTMGVLTLALIANKSIPAGSSTPEWIDHPLRHLHQPGDVPGRVAHHPHPGQGPHRNPDAPGIRRRSLLLRRHSGVDALRDPPVHHTGHQRVGRGRRRGAPPARAVERLPPHGVHLVRHPPRRGTRGSRRLLPAELDRWIGRSGRPRDLADPVLREYLRAVP